MVFKPCCEQTNDIKSAKEWKESNINSTTAVFSATVNFDLIYNFDLQYIYHHNENKLSTLAQLNTV